MAPERRGTIGRDDEQEDGAVVDSPGGASDITSNDDAIACRPAQSKHAKHGELQCNII